MARNAKQILVTGKRMLETDGWLQGSFICDWTRTDETAITTFYNPGALCAAGAIRAAAGGDANETPSGAAWRPYVKALKALAAAIAPTRVKDKDNEWEDEEEMEDDLLNIVARYNDDRVSNGNGRRQVLKKFEKAIKAL